MLAGLSIFVEGKPSRPIDGNAVELVRNPIVDRIAVSDAVACVSHALNMASPSCLPPGMSTGRKFKLTHYRVASHLDATACMI